MADLVTEIHRLISMAEDGKPSLRRSGLWKNKVLHVVKLSKRAELAIRYQDAQYVGACDGSWEEDECDQEIPFGSVMNETRIELLKKRRADTSKSSTERTRTDNVSVLRP